MNRSLGIHTIVYYKYVRIFLYKYTYNFIIKNHSNKVHHDGIIYEK